MVILHNYNKRHVISERSYLQGGFRFVTNTFSFSLELTDN